MKYSLISALVLAVVLAACWYLSAGDGSAPAAGGSGGSSELRGFKIP